MTRVIHTGDTHLGYQQYHVPTRREDFLEAFRQVVADAVAEDVDAVVHAGDLFHDRRPTLSDIMGALSVLRTLDDAGVPFLAIVGNHEAKREAQWLDLYESLGLATRLGAAPVTIGNAAFYGLDFVPRSKREDLAYDFADHDADFAALVSHGLFEPFPHGDWDARQVLADADVQFDAVLLGDDHEPQTKRVEDPHEAWLTYCGSTERASAAERAERGYNLVVFDEAGGVDVRRRGLETRDFAFVDVELGPGEGVEQVRERVGQHDLEDAVAVVTITGDGEPVAPAAIEEYGEEQGALVTRVTDHREVAAAAEELEVSFADPDAAVQERIRELGLSPAARDIDETIRASKVPDSNVDDRVEEHVRELLEDGDPGAFEPAPAEDADTGPAEDNSAGGAEPSDGGPEPTTGAGVADSMDEVVESESSGQASQTEAPTEVEPAPTEGATDAATDEEPAAATDEGSAEPTDEGPGEPTDEGPGEPTDEGPGEPTDEGPGEPTGEATNEASAGTGEAESESQASMEEYL